jgi:Flp pilus assembly protein TadG
VALVEFAFVAPILFVLIFGIMEFGWAFMQNLDVKHGAREGTRLAAVNSTPNNSEATQAEKLAREVCNRMDQYSSDKPQVSITVDRTLVAPTTTADIGDQVTVTITKPLDQLTGFFGSVLTGKTLTSTVDSRLEQAATYANIANFQC